MDQMPPLSLFWQTWTFPKDGHNVDQNEDACRTQLLAADDGTENLLIAVSDGASEPVYSRLWARTLVEAAEADWPTLSNEELSERLLRVRRSYSPIKEGEKIPWYVRNKFLEQGSQATLLVTTVTKSDEVGSLTVRSVAVGDCCLLLFKENGDVYAFPLHTVEEFGLNPALVMSRPQPSLGFVRSEAGAELGDFLLVCSDPLGKWILQCLEDKQATLPFDALLGLLVPVTPEPGAPVEEPGSTELPIPAAEEMAVAPESPESDGFEETSLLKRLWHRINPFRRDTSSQEQPVPNSTDDLKPQKQEPVSLMPLQFEQFIRHYRAPESQPRMRNDDATLVLCLPVRSLGENQRLEVLEIIKGHRKKAGQRSPVVCSVNEQVIEERAKDVSKA